MREVPLLSLRVRPLSLPELLILRLLSRVRADAGAASRTIMRLRFLRAAIGSGLGWRAERGLALAEAGLLFLLASQAASDSEDVRRKGDLIRDFLAGDPPENADVMLAAAIEADLDRLGLLVRSGFDAPGVEAVRH